eukprot:3500640-Rhodomonas_salina.1
MGAGCRPRMTTSCACGTSGTTVRGKRGGEKLRVRAQCCAAPDPSLRNTDSQRKDSELPEISAGSFAFGEAEGTAC